MSAKFRHGCKQRTQEHNVNSIHLFTTNKSRMPYRKNTHWCNDRSFSSKKTVTLFSLKSYEDHKETYINVHVDVLTELIFENGKVAILLLEHTLGGQCRTHGYLPTLCPAPKCTALWQQLGRSHQTKEEWLAAMTCHAVITTAETYLWVTTVSVF